MSEVGRIINKDKSTITALVNKLIKMGYVEKKSEPADSRISLIALNQKGHGIETPLPTHRAEITGSVI